MQFTFFFNWILEKVLNSFIYFYSNIDFYTRFKNHSLFKWRYYLMQSYLLLEKNTLLLIVYIFILYFQGLVRIFKKNYNLFFINITPTVSNSILWIYNNYLYSQFFNFYLKKHISNLNTKDNVAFNSNINFFFKTYYFKYNLLINSKWLSTILYIYNFLKPCLLALLSGLILLIYLIFFFSLQFIKQLAVWFIVGILFFWLISGFNFFIKHSKYGKFTSALQRFWKRANMCFWAVEGFLFLLFYYYYLNSSQEPIFFLDYSSLNQDYLFSLTLAYKSLVILTFLLFFLNILLLIVNYISFSQSIFFIICSTIVILKIFYIESYQFYYVINTFLEGTWIFSDEYNMWRYTIDSPRLRTKNYYFLMCLIAKYWHFIFIFISWFFFIIKYFELKALKYNLLSLNIQNFFILYALNLLTYSQWLKYISHRYLESTYFWLFLNYDNKTINYLVFEFLNVIYSFFNNYIFNLFNKSIFNTTLYSNKLFLYGDNFLYYTTFNYL